MAWSTRTSGPYGAHQDASGVTSVLDRSRLWMDAEDMTNNLDKANRSRGDSARARAYFLDFFPGILGYGVVLILVVIFGDIDGTSAWRFQWALLPVVPALWVLRAVSRHLARVDEYQQQKLLQGIGVGFAVAMITAITLGFLGIAGLDMRLAGWITYGAGMLGWLISSAITARR